LTRADLVSYRYQDFDLEQGKTQIGTSGLVKLLSNLAESGVEVSLTTRDPFSQSDRPDTEHVVSWHTGLNRMNAAGVKIKIHPRLHAKVYSFEKSNGVKYYAVGSSNLTAPGMGFMWTECNIAGSETSDHEAIRRQMLSIWNEQIADGFELWLQRLKRQQPFQYLKLIDG